LSAGYGDGAAVAGLIAAMPVGAKQITAAGNNAG